MSTDVIIVGAGLAGLTAAAYLQRKGLRIQLLEAQDQVGGRVRTDRAEGFRFDRGFQVLLTAYPETRRLLNYEALELKKFVPGALVFHAGGQSLLADPLRHPQGILSTLRAPLTSVPDKLHTVLLKQLLGKATLNRIFAGPEYPTADVLSRYAFSPRYIRDFWRPFLGGIFLENELTTSRRMFDFVFKMFSTGDTALPARGIEMIPRQMASYLPREAVLTGKRVQEVSPGRAVTTDGETFEARAVLVATEGPGLAAHLTGRTPPAGRGVTCLYFAADSSPVTRPVIVLNARPQAWVNNVSVVSDVAPEYAPPGQVLISASVNGLPEGDDDTLFARAMVDLLALFGEQVRTWRPLRIYRIPYALPDQTSVRNHATVEDIKLREGIYLCGDHLMNGSINAAMKSGRLAADVIGVDLA